MGKKPFCDKPLHVVLWTDKLQMCSHIPNLGGNAVCHRDHANLYDSSATRKIQPGHTVSKSNTMKLK